MTNAVLDAIRSRRVVRAMTAEPVARSTIEQILDAGRWASTAGNRHLQRFVVTDHPATLRVLRMVSPGMIQRPTAAITICVDRAAAVRYGYAPNTSGLFVDVGTAAATLMLATHSLGIGAGPVSSFSRAAVGVVLGLPDGWSPELILCLGHAAPTQPAPMSPRPSLRWQDLTMWVPTER